MQKPGDLPTVSKPPRTWRPMVLWTAAILLLALLAVALAARLSRREDQSPVRAGQLAAEAGVCLPMVRACDVEEWDLRTHLGVVVTVGADGSLRLDGRATNSTPLTVSLQEIASGKMDCDGLPDVRVEIAADVEAKWQAVLGVLHACLRAHIFDTHLVCLDDLGRPVRMRYWLPKDSGASDEERYGHKLIIRIKAEGGAPVYRVRDQSWPEVELPAMIRSLLTTRGAPREAHLALKPDPDVRVESVARLMGELRAARFSSPLHCVLMDIDAAEDRRTWDQ
ncbi:MAG TPA: hypothetical protein PK280_05740 [Planctomycetota bacterium]|nr:hypothetical protein [Planctomycetota bacterium]